MKSCILKPNTKRLKQLIEKDGPVWFIQCEEQFVQCFKDSKTGIGLVSINGHIRWVRPCDIEIKE